MATESWANMCESDDEFGFLEPAIEEIVNNHKTPSIFCIHGNGCNMSNCKFAHAPGIKDAEAKKLAKQFIGNICYFGPKRSNKQTINCCVNENCNRTHLPNHIAKAVNSIRYDRESHKKELYEAWEKAPEIKNSEWKEVLSDHKKKILANHDKIKNMIDYLRNNQNVVKTTMTEVKSESRTEIKTETETTKTVLVRTLSETKTETKIETNIVEVQTEPCDLTYTANEIAELRKRINILENKLKLSTMENQMLKFQLENQIE